MEASKPSPKREARIARQNEKKVRDQEKSARLSQRVLEEITAASAVRIGVDPRSIYNMKMCWTIEHADRQESWSWGPRDWTDDDMNRVMLPKLTEFEKLHWKEIEALTTGSGHHAHHSMEVDAICNEAQDRLLKLESDLDHIYRFRLGNKRRLWGFRIVNLFETLWYDPEHRIYPTDPD